MKGEERGADWARGAIRLHAHLTVSAGPVKRAGAETAYGDILTGWKWPGLAQLWSGGLLKRA